MTDGKKLFEFVSQGVYEETFEVVRFKGREALNQPYEFEVSLLADDARVDMRSVLKHRATLYLRVERELPFHGVLRSFEQLDQHEHKTLYRAVLVPKLWRLSTFHQNRVFLDRTILDVFEELLMEAGLASEEYDFRLDRAEYMPHEYICQYRESSLDFMLRWMEHEGISCFFEQRDGFEVLVLAGSASAFRPLPESRSLSYEASTGIAAAEDQKIYSFLCRHAVLPNQVVLKDYNYRKPNTNQLATAVVDPESFGVKYVYGQHFRTPEEGARLARIRAEELRCRGQIFHGESTVRALRTGHLFELWDHYREDCNRGYLLTEIEHWGNQANLLLGRSDLDRERESEQIETGYRNTFTALLDSHPFRPERLTEKPLFHGTMNARIVGKAGGQWGDMDEHGRYKVRLPFELSEDKTSCWMRAIQPFGGSDYGMNFSYPADAEVLLTFIDGDPDRPVISGSVPNPSNPSIVHAGNQSQSGLRTAGGNQIAMEDSDGHQRIVMSSGTGQTQVVIGAGSGDRYELTSQAVSSFASTITGSIAGISSTYMSGSQKKLVAGGLLIGTIFMLWEQIKNNAKGCLKGYIAQAADAGASHIDFDRAEIKKEGSGLRKERDYWDAKLKSLWDAANGKLRYWSGYGAVEMTGDYKAACTGNLDRVEYLRHKGASPPQGYTPADFDQDQMELEALKARWNAAMLQYDRAESSYASFKAKNGVSDGDIDAYENLSDAEQWWIDEGESAVKSLISTAAGGVLEVIDLGLQALDHFLSFEMFFKTVAVELVKSFEKKVEMVDDTVATEIHSEVKKLCEEAKDLKNEQPCVTMQVYESNTMGMSHSTLRLNKPGKEPFRIGLPTFTGRYDGKGHIHLNTNMGDIKLYSLKKDKGIYNTADVFFARGREKAGISTNKFWLYMNSQDKLYLGDTLAKLVVERGTDNGTTALHCNDSYVKARTSSGGEGVEVYGKNTVEVGAEEVILSDGKGGSAAQPGVELKLAKADSSVTVKGKALKVEAADTVVLKIGSAFPVITLKQDSLKIHFNTQSYIKLSSSGVELSGTTITLKGSLIDAQGNMVKFT